MISRNGIRETMIKRHLEQSVDLLRVIVLDVIDY